MSKNFILIIILVIIVGGTGIYLWQKTAQESQFTVPISEQEDYLIYSNQEYGYTLKIPKKWSGKFEIKEDKQITSFIYSVIPEQKEIIFSIIAHHKKQWETLKNEPDYYGTEITVKNKTVFVYILPLENPYELRDREKADEFQNMVDDVKTIIATFSTEN